MQAQFFADYLQELEILQHRLHTDVRDLPAEAMDWSPGPAMNSVAVLLAHIAGVLQEGMDIALSAPPGTRAGISDARRAERRDAAPLRRRHRRCARHAVPPGPDGPGSGATG